MQTGRSEAHVEAPVEQVYAFLIDPRALPEVWPNMIRVENVEERADGTVGFDWVYKMAGIEFRGHSEYSDMVENRRLRSRSEKGIRSTFEWEVRPAGRGTALSVEVQYDIPAPVLGKLAEALVARMNRHDLDTLVENIKLRIEAERSARAPGGGEELRP